VLTAGYFAALGRPWGPTALYDQQLGGDFLWCLSEAIDMPFMIVLLVQWVRSDARDAARIDGALDAVAPVATSTTHARVGVQQVDDRMYQPWWETDASVFGDRAGWYQHGAGPQEPPP
jgi:putative membrane protein